MNPEKVFALSADEKRALQHLAAGCRGTRIAKRANAILLASDGMTAKEVAVRLKIKTETVRQWRERFLQEGLQAVRRRTPNPGVPDTLGM